MISLVRYIKEEFEDISNNKKFKKWFSNSKIIKNGKPRVLYHGTNVKFNEFRTNNEMGAHFGDIEAAREILLSPKGNGVGGSTRIVMPVYLRCEKSLRLPDLYVFDIPDLLEYFENEGKNKLPKDEIEKLRERFNENFKLDLSSAKNIKLSEKNQKDMERDLISVIKSKGYDSIVYKNEREGNSDSYIVFDSNQIKSIYNNGNFNNKTGNIYK